MEAKYTTHKRACKAALLCLSVIVLASLDPQRASANWGPWMFSPPEAPPWVRLTGYLLPAETERHGLYSFPVYVNGEERIFRVEEANNLTGSGLASTLLNHLFPMELHLIGRDELLRRFDESLGTGMVTVTGYLYLATGRLYVRSVEQAGVEPEHP